ncbi:hypothetical protein RD792_015797 [Penstemon davidsonii]|uniref:Pectinesterase n=1 Tax=Penstemon davidsonii TaxID=160366 RepID=A0ABR0CHM7_9LAMI|nr:hypothetical protein RD792_015797 [Penstemon davidsonii]
MATMILELFLFLFLSLLPSFTNSAKYDAIVSKRKIGAYPTIMEAINAAPLYNSKQYQIHIEAGFYTERVEIWANKTNIVLVGDGELNTKISWNRRSPQFGTIDTATVDIRGDGFVARFLTFENSAGIGSDESQAVAVLIISDHAAFYKCTFLGYQDTLYAKEGRQFYRECNIYGTVDFIFGSAAAVFQSCRLFAHSPRTITFTAQQKRKDQRNSGFVLQNCSLTVAPGLEQRKSLFSGYLGRPWSNYSTVVVMESFLDDIIKPEGWLFWNGRTTTTLQYREYQNRGPGAATVGRVHWKGFKVVTRSMELRGFTVGEFIKGNGWLPRTQIPYKIGFMNE